MLAALKKCLTHRTCPIEVKHPLSYSENATAKTNTSCLPLPHPSLLSFPWSPQHFHSETPEIPKKIPALSCVTAVSLENKARSRGKGCTAYLLSFWQAPSHKGTYRGLVLCQGENLFKAEAAGTEAQEGRAGPPRPAPRCRLRPRPGPGGERRSRTPPPPRRPGPAGAQPRCAGRVRGGQGRGAARRPPAGGRDQQQDGGGAEPGAGLPAEPSAPVGGKAAAGRLVRTASLPRGLLPLSGAAFPVGSGTSPRRHRLLPAAARAAGCHLPSAGPMRRCLPAGRRRAGQSLHSHAWAKHGPAAAAAARPRLRDVYLREAGLPRQPGTVR